MEKEMMCKDKVDVYREHGCCLFKQRSVWAREVVQRCGIRTCQISLSRIKDLDY